MRTKLNHHHLLLAAPLVAGLLAMSACGDAPAEPSAGAAPSPAQVLYDLTHAPFPERPAAVPRPRTPAQVLYDLTHAPFPERPAAVPRPRTPAQVLYDLTHAPFPPRPTAAR